MRLKCLLLVIPIVAVLGLGAGHAGAAGFTVCPAGCAYSTIQGAVNAAPAGATILVMSGTYHENITVGKTITLMGTGYGSGSPVVDGSGTNAVTITTGTVTIVNMMVQHGGLGVDVSGGSLALRNSTVRSNSNGGILVRQAATASLTNVTVSGNTTTGNGGGLDVRGTVQQLTNSTFSSNSAPSGQGGAIAVEPGGVVQGMRGVTADSNSALRLGGGIWVGGSVPNAVFLTVTHNTVSQMYGGGLYVDGTISVSNLTASYNSAVVDGGAFDVDGLGHFTLTGGTLNNNTAAFGGAVAVYGTLNMSNATLSNNSATYGGALFNFAYLTMQKTTMSGNHATYGGALYDEDGFTASGLTLSGNSATSDGGAIFNQNNTETLTSPTIQNNAATRVAGGIYNEGGKISTSSGKVSGNRAATGGGIVNCNGILGLNGTNVSLNQPDNQLNSCAL